MKKAGKKAGKFHQCTCYLCDSKTIHADIFNILTIEMNRINRHEEDEVGEVLKCQFQLHFLANCSALSLTPRLW